MKCPLHGVEMIPSSRNKGEVYCPSKDPNGPRGYCIQKAQVAAPEPVPQPSGPVASPAAIGPPGGNGESLAAAALSFAGHVYHGAAGRVGDANTVPQVEAAAINLAMRAHAAMKALVTP